VSEKVGTERLIHKGTPDVLDGWPEGSLVLLCYCVIVCVHACACVCVCNTARRCD